MRSSRSITPRASTPLKRRRAVLAALLLTSLSAAAVLPPWMQHAIHGTAIEAAIYRVMQLPGVSVLFPRPPQESVAELSKLLGSSQSAELYGLRAHQEEQALDFTAAEADWKTYSAQAPDHIAAHFALADFYDRRHMVAAEFTTLLAIAALPAPASDAVTATASQSAWKALDRAQTLATNQALDDASFNLLWQTWMARYPQQATVYGRAFTWQLDHQNWDAVEAVVAAYRKAVPNDPALPVKAEALLALRHGGPAAQQDALAAYDAAFRPLAPGDLDSYFALLAATHSTRKFIADANAALAANPDDLNALARIFYYDQHQQMTPAALAALTAYSAGKDARHAAWTPDELNTFSHFATTAGDPATAARYDFALYNSAGNIATGQSAREAGLADVIALLLNSPDQPIALGAGNLSMYRDIATLDQGPGYWNGVLSLWFNGQSPQNEFASAEQKAQPYFHRSKAVELLALLDRDFPNAAARPALHAQLVQAYAAYGDEDAILSEGKSFLAAFPNSPSRLDVSLAMADADARRKDTAAEFAVYDQLLQELSSATHNMPLSVAALGATVKPADGTDATPAATPNPPAAAAAAVVDALALPSGAPTSPSSSDGADYQRVLERYIGRLTALKQLPQALAVLKKELDRNPNDPLLYEKLAAFLQQNDLSAQQEQVYKLAIDKFNSTSWYDELARFYIRTKRNSDYEALSKKVTDTFAGTEVDAYFAQANGVGAQLALELNLYAHNRFPHDLVFTQNLLTAYATKGTANDAAHAALLRQVWWESQPLTQQFFEYLSSSGKLDAELAALHPATDNPAAQEEAAQGQLWRSHFEQSAPLYTTLSTTYPANEDIGTIAADLNRSLAWLEPDAKPSHIATAVSIEEHLLSEHPADLNRLARIGDILADHADDSPVGLAASSVYWERMPTVAPGVQDSWLQSATVFWDYFQFDAALAEIKAARAQFHDPTLFGYEAGAIDEGKPDMAAAVHEYVEAALANKSVDASDPATDRLCTLARRKDTAALVNAATSNLGDSLPALTLRVNVLSALHRRDESPALLLAALARATTEDQAAAIDALATARQLDAVHAPALMREAALTPDPVERLQLTYALVVVYQSQHNLAQASQLVDATYKANPRILGVIRNTVDFDWQNNRKPQAIATLVEASHSARPTLANQFLAEAADKANDSGDTQQARSIATALLQQDPYNAEYTALVADSYSRADDAAGLKAFFLARIDSLKTAQVNNAPIAAAQRKAYTAQLRQAFIPALTTQHDYAGAVDQYIALVSAYPDDASMVNNAALYALRYGRQDQLIAFYKTTTAASPKDSRFFVALAQTAALDGDTTTALDAYSHAIALRSDRADLYTARASLEEQLQQFDQAAADYQQLYKLTYKDPQWMVALARTRARQGRGADAADALKLAYLNAPRLVPHDRFVVAAQLEKWDLLDQAADFAQQGVKAAGADLLASDTSTTTSDDAATYSRIMARLRKAPAAITVLRGALTAANTSPSSPAAIAAQVAAQGVGSVTDSDWRKQYAATRRTQAEASYAAALQAMGGAVLTYYTPEEKTTYQAELLHQATGATSHALQTFWVPAAYSAGLSEQEAAWRKQLVLAPGDAAQEQIAPYVALESARMAFSELGHTLEAFMASHKKLASGAASQAADAYRDGGDTASEAHVLHGQINAQPVDQGLRDRYLDLLLHHETPVLIALAGNKDDTLADAAANAALGGDSVPVALAAVSARAKALPAVWGNSYTGLTAIYFHDTSAAAGTAFRTALNTEATIGERVATHADTARTLTGNVWFYDAARYGQWLTLSPATATDAEDFLPADLEGAATAQNYTVLAHTYSEAGNTASALTEVHHALELDPDSADALDLQGVVLWNAGRKPEAIDAWRAAFVALRHIEDRAAAPESFWTEFASLAHHVHTYGLYMQLKPAMDDVLGIYLTRNGNYRSNELLHAAYDAAPSPAEGAAWVIALASQSSSPATVLSDLASATWLSPAAREAILLREIALAQAAAAIASADASGYPQTHLQELQLSLLTLYVQQKQDAAAQTLLTSFNDQQNALPAVQVLQMVLAARDGSLDKLIANFQTHPDAAPISDTINQASQRLLVEGLAPQARTLQEFNFDRGLAAHSLADGDYLSLAELRLLTGDKAGAVTLLHSFTQTPGDVYTHLDAAAALLEQHQDKADAAAFLTPLAHGVPWNAAYSVRLAEAQIESGDKSGTNALEAAARNPLAPYGVRARAARDLSKSSPSAANLGSAELALLASGKVSPEAARKPFFVAARITAARQSKDPATQATLLREAVALAPYTTISGNLRIDLFHAQFETADFAAARTTLNALVDPNLATEAQDASGAAAADTDATAVSGDPLASATDTTTGDTTDSGGVTLPASAHVTSPQDSAALALQFAKVYAATGDSDDAISYLRLAITVQPTAPSAATAKAQIASLNAAARLVAANALRRPTIHAALDQPAVVRPKLTVAPDVAPGTEDN